MPGITVCLDGEFEGAFPFSEVATMPTTRPACENIKGDESLILTMTSGSTGTPKPIDISQQNKNRPLAGSYPSVWTGEGRQNTGCYTAVPLLGRAPGDYAVAFWVRPLSCCHDSLRPCG